MADSDGEYVADELSDEERNDGGGGSAPPGNISYATRSAARSGRSGAGGHRPDGGKDKRRKKDRGGDRAAWEDVKRSWDEVVESADGRLALGTLEAGKRARLLRDTTPLQRGIIRHLMLVLDASFAMAEKDLPPSRWRLTSTYAAEFVREFFEQNPISQLGIVAMIDGIARPVAPMGGNPTAVVEKLREFEAKPENEPRGNPSLQNALEMCRGALFHAPSHGTREVLIIYGALLSSDPGDIHDTIDALIADRIRVSVVGLSAQVAICAELCARTNGGDDTCYSVALHEQHFRDLFLAVTTPPVTRTREQAAASLLMMGFPSRTLCSGDTIALCGCHNKPRREGYACTRCRTRVCRLPAECPACGLTLILSTHLARSYHHLFPLRNWVEVSWAEAAAAGSVACFSCLTPFPEVPRSKGKRASGGGGGGGDTEAPGTAKGLSESGRYACEVCGNHFCIDCDVFAHEVIHNCPGCQSDTRGAGAQAAAEETVAAETNGNSHASEEMIID